MFYLIPPENNFPIIPSENNLLIFMVFLGGKNWEMGQKWLTLIQNCIQSEAVLRRDLFRKEFVLNQRRISSHKNKKPSFNKPSKSSFNIKNIKNIFYDKMGLTY